MTEGSVGKLRAREMVAMVVMALARTA